MNYRRGAAIGLLLCALLLARTWLGYWSPTYANSGPGQSALIFNLSLLAPLLTVLALALLYTMRKEHATLWLYSYTAAVLINFELVGVIYFSLVALVVPMSAFATFTSADEALAFQVAMLPLVAAIIGLMVFACCWLIVPYVQHHYNDKRVYKASALVFAGYGLAATIFAYLYFQHKTIAGNILLMLAPFVAVALYAFALHVELEKSYKEVMIFFGRTIGLIALTGAAVFLVVSFVEIVGRVF